MAPQRGFSENEDGEDEDDSSETDSDDDDDEEEHGAPLEGYEGLLIPNNSESSHVN